MKKNTPGERPAPPSRGGSFGGQLARVLVILVVNAALVIAAIVLAGTHRLPAFTYHTLAVGLLPVSAAMGLILACRRIDLAMPFILVLAGNLPGEARWLPSDTFLRLLALMGICGAVGLVSAAVTWYGRISSALWTATLALGISAMLSTPHIVDYASGHWPWPCAVGLAMGLLAAGAAVLGATGLVSVPSTPPINHVGSEGLAGLAGAWVIAGTAIALAAQADLAITWDDVPPRAYATVLPAVVLGGPFILRGRWGALAAVILTALAHAAWSQASHVDGGGMTRFVLTAAAPVAAVPLYLAADWFIRRRTGESAPTGLLA
jgi:hypothetical protein